MCYDIIIKYQKINGGKYMEEDMIKKISVLLSNDMGIKKEDVYKYIKNGLEKSNEAKSVGNSGTIGFPRPLGLLKSS